jgi:predicted nucleic acid-binding protein
VAVYFCDSSAIVKCYVQEQGSAWMVTLLDAAAVHHLYLARITGVEVIAAMRRRARELRVWQLTDGRVVTPES